MIESGVKQHVSKLHLTSNPWPQEKPIYGVGNTGLGLGQTQISVWVSGLYLVILML